MYVCVNFDRSKSAQMYTRVSLLSLVIMQFSDLRKRGVCLQTQYNKAYTVCRAKIDYTMSQAPTFGFFSGAKRHRGGCYSFYPSIVAFRGDHPNSKVRFSMLPYYYLRQVGYVMPGVCLFVFLSVGLSVGNVIVLRKNY